MKRRPRPAALSTLVAALYLLVTAQPISAGVSFDLFVDDDAVYGASGCDDTGLVAFDTIQDAVDAAVVANTKIRVCPGTYTGQVSSMQTTLTDSDPRHRSLAGDRDAGPERIADESLFRITGVEDTKVVWLNFEIPTAQTCGEIDMVINVDGAANTQLRANHIRAIGTDTIGDCGFQRGIRTGNSPNTLISWNRVIDFTVVGIAMSKSSGAIVRGNTLRLKSRGRRRARLRCPWD